MKKSLFVAVFFLIILALSVGCSVEDSSATPADSEGNGEENETYKIGFANLTEEGAFFVEVREGMERAAKEHGVELLTADNRLDGATALSNAENFVTQNVDFVVEFQTDEKMAPVIMEKFDKADIPVIAIDIPMPGATFFGANNPEAGFLAGEYLGKKAQEEWDGKIDKVIMLELPQSGVVPAQRMQGQLDGLKSVIPDIKDEDILRLDSKNTLEESKRLISDVLSTLPDAEHLAILSINDDTALGAVAALEIADRTDDAFIVGQGADQRGLEELQKENTPYLGSTAYFPDKYGEYVIPAAIKILEGEEPPKEIFVEHEFVSKENLDEFLK